MPDINLLASSCLGMLFAKRCSQKMAKMQAKQSFFFYYYFFFFSFGKH
jgi:hypothetical protein